MFFNRERDKEQFRRVISGEPNLVYFVYGPINSGKTSLVCEVLRELPEEYVVFYINLRGRMIRDTNNFLDVLFDVDEGRSITFRQIKEYAKEILKDTGSVIEKVWGIPIPENIFRGIMSSEERSKDVFKYLERLFISLKEQGKIPVFVLDELQMLREVVNGGNGRSILSKLFNFYVRMTKETHICHSIAVTSDSLFIEQTYSNARLEGRSEYILVDDLNKEEAFEVYEGMGLGDKELLWENIGGKIGDMIRIYEKKKRGIQEAQSINQMIQDEINRIKWILEYTEDEVEYKFGEKIYKVNREEIEEALKTFTDKECITDEEIEKLNDVIYNPAKYEIPSWIMNRRKDYETGKDMHLVGTDLTIMTENDIKRLKKIK